MKNRMFNGAATTRLIVSVEVETVVAIDALLKKRRIAGANRSEFVRQALEAKLREHA